MSGCLETAFTAETPRTPRTAFFGASSPYQDTSMASHYGTTPKTTENCIFMVSGSVPSSSRGMKSCLENASYSCSYFVLACPEPLGVPRDKLRRRVLAWSTGALEYWRDGRAASPTTVPSGVIASTSQSSLRRAQGRQHELREAISTGGWDCFRRRPSGYGGQVVALLVLSVAKGSSQ